jgi:hypothetical protein
MQFLTLKRLIEQLEKANKRLPVFARIEDGYKHEFPLSPIALTKNRPSTGVNVLCFPNAMTGLTVGGFLGVINACFLHGVTYRKSPQPLGINDTCYIYNVCESDDLKTTDAIYSVAIENNEVWILAKNNEHYFCEHDDNYCQVNASSI